LRVFAIIILAPVAIPDVGCGKIEQGRKTSRKRCAWSLKRPSFPTFHDTIVYQILGFAGGFSLVAEQANDAPDAIDAGKVFS
jgi:hypothetical protein